MKSLPRLVAAVLLGGWLLLAQAAGPVIVAFGDSITEGAGTQAGSGAVRFPDRLAERLRAQQGAGAASQVLNAGISGNRLLADGVGPKGIDRFANDALARPGVTHVLILIGINDIGFSMPEGAPGPIRGQPDAKQITDGLRLLIDQARARGVKVLLGTLLPFEGASYWDKEKEARRDAVNRWIRNRRDVAAVVDFDAALRSPSEPRRLSPAYDSGDHLHPGNAGHAAMADAIDLRALRR
ncbi:SGNH/GDSL hydrolase family protein [Variovorax sp. J22P168]|uniref:SGNH/GDSL hydrolase family protein n=1 Tax=Variovorax jilinensis TaxID=3053513 RepID=UPI00257604D2|nr:SGNH/GDSL hydrolase family protein [Variovorax sp. J22P168]MDM0010931.1 SGNH/GDSL hydrolase family protein [Variovorax sp. J22P168]